MAAHDFIKAAFQCSHVKGTANPKCKRLIEGEVVGRLGCQPHPMLGIRYGQLSVPRNRLQWQGRDIGKCVGLAQKGQDLPLALGQLRAQGLEPPSKEGEEEKQPEPVDPELEARLAAEAARAHELSLSLRALLRAEHFWSLDLMEVA